MSRRSASLDDMEAAIREGYGALGLIAVETNVVFQLLARDDETQSLRHIEPYLFLILDN